MQYKVILLFKELEIHEFLKSVQYQKKYLQ